MEHQETEASAADAAYAKVKERILDGDLAGGTMVSEGTIADELGMSRTPSARRSCACRSRGGCGCTPSAVR